MALDKQFLKYKLEKIKNDRIWKDQDAESKRRSRKENAKLAQEEADAIHSYLTGEDPIDIFDNKSYLESKFPGALYLNRKGQLNIRQSQDDPKVKSSALKRLLRKHKTIAAANKIFGKQLKVLKKLFDSLNIRLTKDELKLDGKIQARSMDVRGDINLRGNENINGDLSVEGDIHLRESSVTQNGYTYLPNGILIQWGIDTSDSDGDHTITFPIPFPNNCFSVSVNHKLSGGWNTDEKYGYPITAKSYDTNGFVINRNNEASATINLNYMAIGN